MERNIVMKKIILLLITVILILGLSIRSFAIDELNNDDNTNTQTENTNENPNNNENENNNEEINNPENNNQEINNTETEQVSLPEENNNSTQQNIQQPSTQTEVKSRNTDLKSLSLDVEGITPEFSKDNLEYYLIVDLSIEKIKIDAVPEDLKSTVTVRGNSNLEEGENTIDIIVKAESGDTKTYKIHVTRTKDLRFSDASLKSLSVKGFNFYPSFKPNIYNYNLLINEKIDKLDILAETEVEEASFEITGNENLAEGDNLIKIVVTAQNGEAKREYKINAYISSKTVKTQQMNKKQAYVLIAILGLAIIVTGAFVIKQRNK